jgi:ribonuclease Y
MNEILILVFSLVGLIVSFLIGTFASKKIVSTKLSEAEQTAERIRLEAEKEGKNIKKEKMLEVKEEWHKRKQEFENETQTRRVKMQEWEKKLQVREEDLKKETNRINSKDRETKLLEERLIKKDEQLKIRIEQADALVVEHTKHLEQISGLTKEEAKARLIDNMANEAKSEAAQLVKQIRDEAKASANKEAQKIIVQAIQRTASDHSVETTVSVVNLDSDEMKGRIIGREGRNIRAFEAATGIDLIIDDTPEAVVISGFDPFRREVAKVALEKLMLDGRIHPSRIEEIVDKTRKELEEEIVHVGENALMELGLHGMHAELIRMIGKMKYRSSYGQNLLNHSIEVSYLCGIMAAELGLDTNLAKRSGLLHDVGKCVDKDTEGPHALIGYELAKKYKENHVVANAIGAHHEDIEMETPIAVLVQAADSISGARPGARRESLENYVKRLEKLESLAQGFTGVSKTFAIQAGREIRVIVEPEKVDDFSADSMANGIAERIEKEMEYPGQIKVTVIRERRSVSIAK